MPENEDAMKWEPTLFESGKYVVWRANGWWYSRFGAKPLGHFKTSEEAFAACERHKRENKT